MQNIKLVIEYDGTDFKGWQSQAKGERTVQQTIVKTYQQVFNETIKLIGSGRTDSGVHARGQVANFHTQSVKPPSELLGALNACLPEDIAIIKASKVPNNFHAQYDAKSKTYRYSILNRNIRSALEHSRILFYPHTIDLDLMKAESLSFIGTHDFKSFKGNNRSNQDERTTRTINALKITKKGSDIRIDITANGFMYKMVRNIVGTLLAVGSGKLPKGSVTSILRHKNRKMAAPTAPAIGLCLMKVHYSA